MLTFAIIGCGAIGTRHALHAAATGRLTAVCDIDISKAQRLAEAYGARVYADAAALLENEKDVDVVAVCTPNGWHARHSIDSLKAGFHVLCEKPMAIRSTDARDMIRAAEQADRQLFVIKQNRFNPPVVIVKQLLEEGRLGRICSVQVNCSWNRMGDYYLNSWHGTRDMDGGILFTQFSHFIDILYWMAGDVSEVTAFTGNFLHKGQIEFEDAGVACLRFASGAIGSLHFTINSYGRNMEGSVAIIGEKGSVKIGGQYLNTLDYQQVEGLAIIQPVEAKAPNQYGAYEGSMSNHDKMYQHVADVIAGRDTNRFSGHEGLRTVEIIEKIYQAAK